MEGERGSGRRSTQHAKKGNHHAFPFLYTVLLSFPPHPPYRSTVRMCGIIGIFKHEGNVNAELYEGLLMLQHRGQDSAGMVTTSWDKFKEYKENGLVKDVFSSQPLMDSMRGRTK
jgi:amidophosphoribosyltransferase